MAANKRTEEERAAVVASILGAMASDGLDWVVPWARLEAPVNGATGRPYEGGRNRAHLLAAMRRIGSVDPRFLTFNQARQAGYKVRKGEKSCIIEHWITSLIPSPDGDVDEFGHPVFISVPRFNKCWSVFNASQLEGIEPYAPASFVEPSDPHIWEIADRLIASSRCEVKEGADRQAGWAPASDTIFIADRRMFVGENGPACFIRVLAHEIAHSTSVPLNRKVTTDHEAKDYALEELVAELASAFVASALGFSLGEADGYFTEQHAAYLQFWSSRLVDDPDAFFRAATLAGKAADYIIARYEATPAPQSVVGDVADEPARAGRHFRQAVAVA